MKDDWWNKKAEAVQDLAESGNPRTFFESLKEVYGPRHSVTSPLYNKPGTVLLTNKVDVMDRWKEQNHFSMVFLLNLFKNLNLCTSFIKQVMNVFSFFIR